MSISVKEHAINDRLSALDGYLKTKALGWTLKNLGRNNKKCQAR